MLIRELYGIGQTKSAIGLELELEASKKQPMSWIEDPSSLWTAHADGSLRQYGVEYVFRKPLFDGDIKAALDQFEQNTRGVPFIESVNGSTHVHYNVGHLLVTEVMNIVVAWSILEDVFLSMCHPSRRGNLFALRFSDSNALSNTLQQVIKKNGLHSAFHTLGPDAWKYSSMNLAAIRQYGTLEFRCYHSTHNINEIHNWINRLINFCEQAVKFKNPVDLLESADSDIGEFALKLSGIPLTDELVDAIRRNISTAFRLAFVTDSWENIEEKRESLKERKPTIKQPKTFPPARENRVDFSRVNITTSAFLRERGRHSGIQQAEPLTTANVFNDFSDFLAPPTTDIDDGVGVREPTL